MSENMKILYYIWKYCIIYVNIFLIVRTRRNKKKKRHIIKYIWNKKWKILCEILISLSI